MPRQHFIVIPHSRLRLFSLSLLLLSSAPALAYVGPGLGAGALAVIFGLLASVLLAVVAVVWYPLKRLLRRRRAASAGVEPAENRAEATDAAAASSQHSDKRD